MGNTHSSSDDGEVSRDVGRVQGVTQMKRKSLVGRSLPSGSSPALAEDWPFITDCLAKVLLFNRLDVLQQRAIVQAMYERPIPAGEIIIQEGDTGMGASELYVVKKGEFEVLQRRKGVNLRVNMKSRGDTFGELSLMYDCPRSATVAATQDSIIWVLERDVFRQHVRRGQEEAASQLELFLNQVPILSPLSKEEKMKLLDAFEERTFPAGATVVQQGEPGDLFYIIKEGEATVLQNIPTGTEPAAPRRVNQLFRSDFFGEAALFSSTPRAASVVAVTNLVCLTLDRENFISLLGPLESLMARQKSPQVVGAKLMKLASGGIPSQQQAMVNIKRRRFSKSQEQWVWELVRAVGHLDEVLELKSMSRVEDTSELESCLAKILFDFPPCLLAVYHCIINGTSFQIIFISDFPLPQGNSSDVISAPVLTLVEGAVLGSGAFSRVSVVTEEGGSGRAYALKRMRKTAVAQCPEHIFCEQAITRNLTHPFCIRQYGSFQDKYHLYFLFDYMPGGDLMDVLVSEARIETVKAGKGALRRGCLAPHVKILRGLSEDVAKFYAASIILALEYLHDHNIVYRDLKPENVFIDQYGYPKLGDFGFAKVLNARRRTFTFCGTPGYVAPENILAHGYGMSVDWWGLGVVLYVLLTGKQPFSSPKTDDPMEVMRRIVDDDYQIKFPAYVSSAAKDLILRLLERKPTRRLGVLAGKAGDVKHHRWFTGFDWQGLAARKFSPPRRPNDDAAKRIKELANQERRQGSKSRKETIEELAEATKIFEEF